MTKIIIEHAPGIRVIVEEDVPTTELVNLERMLREHLETPDRVIVVNYATRVEADHGAVNVPTIIYAEGIPASIMDLLYKQVCAWEPDADYQINVNYPVIVTGNDKLAASIIFKEPGVSNG